jgi:polyketide biosynthesis acyl carrier protein
MSSWDDTLDVVRDQVVRTLPDVTPEDVGPDSVLADLGANSLDRMDIVTASQDELRLSIPISELGGLRSVRDVTDLLHAHRAAT